MSRGDNCGRNMMVMLQLLPLFILLTSAHAHSVATTEFHNLTAEYWEWRLQEAPEFATDLDIHTYDDRVEQYSLEVLEDRKVKVDAFMARLQAIDVSHLHGGDKISYAVLKDSLQTYIDGYKWRFYGPMNPVNFLEGLWTDPESWYPMDIITNETTLTTFVTRLIGWQQQALNYIIRMRKAIEMGTTDNWVSEAQAVTELETMISTDPKEFVWFKPFNDSAMEKIGIPDANRPFWKKIGELMIQGVFAYYDAMKDVLVTEYKNHSRTAYGVNSFPDGEAYYRACLKWHLSLDMTPEEVHQTGLQEVARISREMKTIMNKLGFTGTNKEFFASLRNDSRFIITDPDAIVERYRSIIKQRIEPKLPKYFKNLPNMPAIVEKLPYDGISGQYLAGSPDNSRPGIFQVNVMRPGDNPTYNMVALTMHETDPGHNLQITFSQSFSGMPPFRRFGSDDAEFLVPYSFPSYTAYVEITFAQSSGGIPSFRRFVDYNKMFLVPYTFPFYTAYIEGWALYAESLGDKDELDIYQDDYELMGRYGSEIFRACRLVVDTGLHHYNWTRDEAIEYMLNYTAETRETLTIEIDRYITWPGQACAYKIGELKIKELRNKAELLLGDKFDIRDFHAVILENGAVPLPVLEDLVNAWINTTLEGAHVNIEDLITLGCNVAGWDLRLDMSRLRQHYPDARAHDIYLGENSCTGLEHGGWLVFRQGLRECLTSEKISGDTLIYNNELVYAVHDPVRPFVVQRFNWSIAVECDISRNASSSTHVLTDTHNSTGHLVTTSNLNDVKMAFYQDPNYRQSLAGNPLHVSVGTEVYVKVFTMGNDWSIKMRVHTCYTNTSESGVMMKSYLIKDGCEVDGNTHIISQSSHETRFVFQYFEYVSNHEFHVSCDVTFCDNHDYSRRCSQTCHPTQFVGRRSVENSRNVEMS